MYNFFKSSITNEEQQRITIKKIYIVVTVFIICSILLVAEPLRVSATEVEAPLSDVGSAIVGMVAGGFASYAATSWAAATLAGASAVVLGGVAIPTAIIIIVFGIVVATGVSLTVTQVVRALNSYWELHQADFENFIDKIINGFKDGLISLRGKINLSPTLFNDIYNWVKTNIIGFFDERVSNVDFSGAVDGYELYLPPLRYDNQPSSTDLQALFSSDEYIFDDVSIFKSDLTGLSSSQWFEKTSSYKYVYNENTGFSTMLNTVISANGSGSNITVYQNIILGENGTKITRYVGRYLSSSFAINNSQGIRIKCLYPYKFVGSNVSSSFDCIGFYAMCYNTNGTTLYNAYPLESQSDKYYRLNDVTIKITSSGVVKDYGTCTYSLKFNDGTVKSTFSSIENFIYLLSTQYCDLVVNDTSSGTTSTDKNATINYTTVNNYYNDKRDILAKPAKTVAGKIADGAIDDTSEGSISIGLSDVIDGAVIDNSTADILSVGSVASVTDVSSTSVTTDGTEVLPSGEFLDVATAFVISANNIRNGFNTIKLKFPFDVIPNVRNWLNNLVSTPEPLVIDYDIVAPVIGTYPVHMDFSRYSVIIDVIHWIVRVSVAIGLLIASKEALKLM